MFSKSPLTLCDALRLLLRTVEADSQLAHLIIPSDTLWPENMTLQESDDVKRKQATDQQQSSSISMTQEELYRKQDAMLRYGLINRFDIKLFLLHVITGSKSDLNIYNIKGNQHSTRWIFI
jgi:hypothetical protein